MSTRHTTTKRRASRLPLLLIAVLGTEFGVVVPPAAHAQGAATAACVIGKHNVTWSPGVTNVVAPHDVTTNTNWTCDYLRWGESMSTTATSHAEFTESSSCTNIISTGPTTWTIKWSDGFEPNTSTFVFTSFTTTASTNLEVHGQGSITEGRFSGHKAISEFTLTNLAATLGKKCASPAGVTDATGVATFIII